MFNTTVNITNITLIAGVDYSSTNNIMFTLMIHNYDQKLDHILKYTVGNQVLSQEA